MSPQLVFTVAAPAALGCLVGIFLGRRLGSDTAGFFCLLREEQSAAYGLVFMVVGALGGLGWSYEIRMEHPESPVMVMTEVGVPEDGACRPRAFTP